MHRPPPRLWHAAEEFHCANLSQFHLLISVAQELEEGVVKVKDLAANTQDEVKMAELADDLKRRIAARGEFSLIAAGAAAQAAAA